MERQLITDYAMYMSCDEDAFSLYPTLLLINQSDKELEKNNNLISKINKNTYETTALEETKFEIKNTLSQIIDSDASFSEIRVSQYHINSYNLDGKNEFGELYSDTIEKNPNAITVEICSPNKNNDISNKLTSEGFQELKNIEGNTIYRKSSNDYLIDFEIVSKLERKLQHNEFILYK